MSQIRELKEYEKTLTAELKEVQDDVLARATKIKGRKVTLSSLHGSIGGKNNTYVDSVRDCFQDPQEFIAAWVDGLIAQVQQVEANQKERYNGNIYQNTLVHNNLRLVRDDLVWGYTEKFLTRNFYRNFLARTRAKPAEELWQIWFGADPLTWGVLISPVYRNSGWTNDLSEMRRAEYSYWTIGHILETGIIVSDNAKAMQFESTKNFIDFYRNILKRSSVSQYEHGIADRYIDYISNSENIMDEPFLIPELRYEGLAKKHRYRLDFTVLNPHTMEKVGFELSPSSTHCAIKKMKDKTQKEANAELAVQWTKEMKKRNDYFETFGITTVTFPDESLSDLDACFEKISEVLSRRSKKRKTLTDATNALQSFEIS